MPQPIQITENDIRAMVSESVKKLLNERNGAISENFLPLAQFILQNATEERQKIGEEELAEYFTGLNNYPEIVFPLYYQKAELPENVSAKYEIDDNTLYINKSLNISVPDIMHELTHFINHMGNTSMDEPNNLYNENSEEEKNANYAFYLFKRTEMNARLSEFFYYLRENGAKYNKISDYDDILFLADMNTIIEILNDFQNYRTFSYMLLNLFKNNGIKISNIKALSAYLKRQLHKFIQKANKILYENINH